MSARYPANPGAIGSWARANNVTIAEGRVRFAQSAILRALALSRPLRELLVFKGGNALDFVWYPNRSTQDLDFSADMSQLDAAWPLPRIGDYLREQLVRALAVAAPAAGFTLALQRFNQQPPGTPPQPFITYQISIGYAFPDQRALVARMAQQLPSPQMIPLDISLHEPICADEPITLDDAGALRVCTAEDIVAEKLRALLQQPLRKRDRRQDLLDIAVLLRAGVPLDQARVAAFLLRKAAARGVPVSRRAFQNPELIARASTDYALLTATVRNTFIPHDEALSLLHSWLITLPIQNNTQILGTGKHRSTECHHAPTTVGFLSAR